MHFYTQTITNTARLTYQYTVTPGTTPKRLTTADSANNITFHYDKFNTFLTYKCLKNCICFPCKVCKICSIQQIIKIQKYQLCPHRNYSYLKLVGTISTIVKYTSCHQLHHKVSTSPLTIELIVSPFITPSSLSNINLKILEIHPQNLTDHHLSLNTMLAINIRYTG